jgi:hypothetical protein
MFARPLGKHPQTQEWTSTNQGGIAKERIVHWRTSEYTTRLPKYKIPAPLIYVFTHSH